MTTTKREGGGEGGGEGAEQVLAMLSGEGGGHNKFWGSFYTVAGSFGHIEGEGGAKSFHSLKGWRLTGGGGEGGGGAKSFGPAIFPFCSPPPPTHTVINDQSLTVPQQSFNEPSHFESTHIFVLSKNACIETCTIKAYI